MTKSERIYVEAMKYMGTEEIAGPTSNPVIAAMIEQAAKWLDRDDSSTPWCGCFRGTIGLATGTGVPKDHFRAREWMHWGDPVASITDARKGDTLVFKRRGGYHVTLFSALLSPTRVACLGGNQSNSVNISPHAVADLVAIRR